MRFVPASVAVFGLALCGACAARDATATSPVELPGADAFVYRTVTGPRATEPLRLFVFKPANWRPADRRSALVWFFGGGWARGTPANSTWWAKWAAAQGMVGIAPDYRVEDRFGTSPLASVADARDALRWIQQHADELGLDPRHIVVGGNSAGGHLALWTAIRRSPPGSIDAESPIHRPAALILTSPVSDTSPGSGYTPDRFGADALALSPAHQLDHPMPPVLMFHGDADRTVPIAQSLRLRDKLQSDGDACELVIAPGGSHNYGGELPGWADKTQATARDFLRGMSLIR